MYQKAHKDGLSGNATTIIDLNICTAHPSGLRQYGIEILVQGEKPLYLAANNLENQKKWLNWTVMSPSFMGDEKDLFLPLINALDNYEALR